MAQHSGTELEIERGGGGYLDGIRRNRGPSCLVLCRINVRGHADALRTNIRMETLLIRAEMCSSEELLFILESREENTGIKKLVFQGQRQGNMCVWKWMRTIAVPFSLKSVLILGESDHVSNLQFLTVVCQDPR